MSFAGCVLAKTSLGFINYRKTEGQDRKRGMNSRKRKKNERKKEERKNYGLGFRHCLDK